jgi:sulfate adenylyltransferase subunit 1
VPIQYVARESEGTGHQPRTLWGRIARGQIKIGDAVHIFPSQQEAVVSEVRVAGSLVDRATAGQSAGVLLDRQLDVSRGDWIIQEPSVQPVKHFSATLAWLDTEPAVVGRKYWLRHGNQWAQARITAIESRLDIHTLQSHSAKELAVNEMGHVQIETQLSLPILPYSENRVAGSLIVVDPTSNRTSGALLVQAPD